MWLCGENMTWSYRQCSNKAVGRIFQGVHVGSTLDVAELVLAQRHLMLRAFSTTGFTIWTRYVGVQLNLSRCAITLVTITLTLILFRRNSELTKIKRKDVVQYVQC